jgi:hypothetical protein
MTIEKKEGNLTTENKDHKAIIELKEDKLVTEDKEMVNKEYLYKEKGNLDRIEMDQKGRFNSDNLEILDNKDNNKETT